CIDLNDHYFTNGDTILFFFGAHNTLNEWTWWCQATGTVDDIEKVAKRGMGFGGRGHNAMEMQILPGEGVANGGDILYVDYFSGRGAQPYFDSAFMFITDPDIHKMVDRFDKRGPSSLVGNGLGFHAKLLQLVSNYRMIIWNSGDLYAGTVGDGSVEKSDDYGLLFNFLDQHTNVNGCGIYFSGDDLAEELDRMNSASSQNFKNVYMPHDLVTGDHNNLHRVSPLGIGEAAGSGTPPSNGLFAGDTLVVYGGCPVINDFDVIAPLGTATIEMCYDPANEADDTNPAIVAFDTLNINGFRAATVLSGFSFHNIRDDEPRAVPDRAWHLVRIIRWIAGIVDDPTPVKPGAQYTNSLAQNYPNPFNPSTTIKYSVKDNAHVSLKIYNVAGQLVRTLVNSDMTRGAYTETWNGRSNSGDPVSSGVYFYKMATKNFSMTKKMVLLR
ncbi:MAG: T9SS type A sorting domain-containing protein, partial [Candidatus Latescibacterota bacterium]